MLIFFAAVLPFGAVTAQAAGEEELQGVPYEVTISDMAEEELYEVMLPGTEFGNMVFITTEDAEDYESKDYIEMLYQTTDSLRGTEAVIYLIDMDNRMLWITGYKKLSGVISSVAERLRRLSGSVATVRVKEVKQATGGYNTAPVIPRHAKGYIATGPTLTNQGWIGEDGVEAVSNWATGGAVVPLTNTKYMLPIADAIAEGMTSRGVGGSGVTYNLYINDAHVNDDPAIQSAFIGLMTTLERKGAMNVGGR